ncbi:Transmembrane protein [Entamoeba marina]
MNSDNTTSSSEQHSLNSYLINEEISNELTQTNEKSKDNSLSNKGATNKERNEDIEIITDESEEEATSIDNHSNDEPYINVECLDDGIDEYPISETLQILFETMLLSLIPLFGIVIVGGIIVAVFYGVDSAEEMFFDKISEAQARFSYIFSCICSILGAGIIPFLITCCVGAVKLRYLPLQFLGTIIFFGFVGIIQSSWVMLNNMMNENISNEINKAVMLVIVDQTVFGMAMNFNVISFYKEMNIKRFILREYPITVVCDVMCWVPGMAVVYSLPIKIQFPITILLDLVYSLMLSISNMITARLARWKSRPNKKNNNSITCDSENQVHLQIELESNDSVTVSNENIP